MEFIHKKQYAIPIVLFFGFCMFYKPVIYFLILGSLLILIGIKSWAVIKGIKKTELNA